MAYSPLMELNLNAVTIIMCLGRFCVESFTALQSVSLKLCDRRWESAGSLRVRRAPLDFTVATEPQIISKVKRHLGDQLSLARVDRRNENARKWFKFIVMYKYSPPH